MTSLATTVLLSAQLTLQLRDAILTLAAALLRLATRALFEHPTALERAFYLLSSLPSCSDLSTELVGRHWGKIEPDVAKVEPMRGDRLLQLFVILRVETVSFIRVDTVIFEFSTNVLPSLDLTTEQGYLAKKSELTFPVDR